jgi:uncharacterized protein YaaQ
MNMKMIMVILDDSDSDAVMETLHDAGFPMTVVDSTGGLLRRGTSTLIAGVIDNQIDNVINMINQECSPCVNPIKKRATIMVFNVDHFEQIS